jgi:transcriptional regulator LmrA/YxaF-like protein
MRPLGAAKARELAILLIVALEGAFVLSRAMRCTDALAVAGANLAKVVRDAMSPTR